MIAQATLLFFFLVQIATVLDARYGCAVGLGEELATTCRSSLIQAIQTEHDRQVLLQAEGQRPSSRLEANTSNSGRQVANSRASLSPDLADIVSYVERIQQERPAPTRFRPSDQADEFFQKIVGLWRSANKPTMGSDPMQFYTSGNGSTMQLIRTIALDYLSVPVGEAPSERIFSICSRIIRKERAKMSARHVAVLTFLKKNRIALAE